MANELGPDTWARCADYLKSPLSKEYELSYERSGTMPKSPFAGEFQPKFLPPVGMEGTIQVYNMDVLNKDVNNGNQGTQMDAFGHFSYLEEPWTGSSDLDTKEAKYFGGFSQNEIKPTKDSPLLKLGIESVPPIITTAILLDVRKHVFEGKSMKAGQYVTVEHLETALEASGLEERGILPGDVVLINTGWSAKFLGSKKVVGVGLDTPFVDAVADPNSDIKFEVPENTPKNLGFPVHHFFLTQAGIYTLENLKLKELAKDQVEKSCVIILPLLSTGSAASPIRPVAIGKPKDF